MRPLGVGVGVGGKYGSRNKSKNPTKKNATEKTRKKLYLKDKEEPRCAIWNVIVQICCNIFSLASIFSKRREYFEVPWQPWPPKPPRLAEPQTIVRSHTITILLLSKHILVIPLFCRFRLLMGVVAIRGAGANKNGNQEENFTAHLDKKDKFYYKHAGFIYWP